jgi:hypothetical protein
LLEIKFDGSMTELRHHCSHYLRWPPSTTHRRERRRIQPM